MIINNNFQNIGFNGFKDFFNIYNDEISYEENKFIDNLKDWATTLLDSKNGKKELPDTNVYLPPDEIYDYDVIDIYGDIYRDTNNKNEVFLKLRIKPTPAAIERIKKNTFDKNAKEELISNPLATEFVSQPLAIRSRSTVAQLKKILEEKLLFFRRFAAGNAQWKTSTKDLLKSSDKPKFGWDRDLIDSFAAERSRAKGVRAANVYVALGKMGSQKF